VTGARLMLEGLDPTTSSGRSIPETLLDPSTTGQRVSRVTVPPTALILHMTIAALPYHAQRTIWLYVQWLLLLASIFLFSRCARSGEQARAIWIIGLLLSCTGIWRFHVERARSTSSSSSLSRWRSGYRDGHGRTPPWRAAWPRLAPACAHPRPHAPALLVFRKWKLSAAWWLG